MVTKIKVGVFTEPGKRGPKFRAYTTWYNPRWEGCCEHVVTIEPPIARGDAKFVAIALHKRDCMGAES